MTNTARSPISEASAPKLALMMAAAEEDVLAYVSFPAQHRAKVRSTNPLERLNGEIKRRTGVVDTSLTQMPSLASLVFLLEQNDEWEVQRGRYML